MEDDTGEKSSIIVGLIENRAKEYIETSSSYQNTKTLLNFYDPMVIIVTPTKLAPDGMVGVSELVDRFCSSTTKVMMARSCFDDTRGAVLVKNLAAKEPSALGLDTYYKQYYLCLAAAAATIKWIEAEKGVIITNHSLSVTFNGSFDHMNVDATRLLFSFIEQKILGTLFEAFCFHFILFFSLFMGMHSLEKAGMSIYQSSLHHLASRVVTYPDGSVQNLEIIEPMHSSLWGTNNKKRSLFHMLKTTRTIGGTRLLRANLLQPLKDIDTINARLDCLDELMSNEQLFFGLSQALRKFPKETDKVLCHFCFKQKKVTNGVLAIDNSRKSQILISSIILLKTALDALPLLSKALKDANCFLLRNVYKSICANEKFASMRERIGEVIDEDVLHARVPFVARTQQCFAVKAGIDGLLDIARRSFCDTSEAIHNLANKYREDFKLPNLKIPYNNRQGFYFSIPQKDIQGKLARKFIQVIKHGNNIHCSSLELASLNVRNKSAAKECYIRTEFCLEALMDAIREDVSALTLLAEVLCLLDMIVNSFAHTISMKPVDKYTRPQFTYDGPLAIDSGRHPILESVHNEFVANNIFLSEASNMIIVTGPNMSGKSTYLQQVCLVVILAQIGCYVPARFATLRVVDRIFTRMGTMDSVESNSSTPTRIPEKLISDMSKYQIERQIGQSKKRIWEEIHYAIVLPCLCEVCGRHLRNIFMTEMKETAFILQNASHRSLIVVDELGRATSSSDGFAIAWSCCEHLLALRA
ncbi:UNVERIFIED_CONTAM: DNA mismatch repair protein MSH4 [Sesamum calycinum]|uniref:DNA mismatch repair protein MSH4 n=1 Tax=Sesamum calycinum TaxID=2727403 RepID=A0AAW2M3C9_9LAMI